MKPFTTLPEMHELAEQIGEFIHYWGFKRVHGRIWTHMFLAKKPIDAADLVHQMGISKALVSISLRELMEYDVIHEVGMSSRGTHLYRTNPDILSVILTVLRQREKRMLSRIQAAFESLDRVSPEDRERGDLSDKHMEQLSALVSRATVALEGFVSLKSVDFGQWRNDFLTVNLEDEAELRKRSVVGPATREHIQHYDTSHDANHDEADESHHSEGAKTPKSSSTATLTATSDAASSVLAAPTLPNGKANGSGFQF